MDDHSLPQLPWFKLHYANNLWPIVKINLAILTTDTTYLGESDFDEGV